MKVIGFLNKKSSFLLLLLVFPIPLFLTANGCKQSTFEVQSTGRIDLSNYDFTKDVIELTGPWEFYWEKFFYPNDFVRSNPPVPDGYSLGLKPWNTVETKGKKPESDGYATYRLRFLLPEHPPKMGIRISKQNSSFRLLVNKQEVALSGKPGLNRADTIPSRANRIVYFQPVERELDIVLHVANFYIFRGGLRGYIQLGSEEVIEKLRNRGLALELIMAGFGIYIFLYHLFLFLQRPKDRSILYFLFLSGSFLPRYFLLSEKTLSLLITEIPFDFEIRIIHTLNVLTPSLLLLFMYSIFPEFIKLRTVRIIFLSTLLYFGTWFFSSHVSTKFYIIYSICATISVLIPIGIALFQGIKSRIRGVLFHSLGILIFVILLVFAFMGVILGETSGFIALLAFTALSFFQALFLSASYSEKMQTNLIMANQLRESKDALAKQREELELNLHDALGGSLTDLKIFTHRMRNDIPKKSWPDAMSRLDRKISDIIQAFRTQLLFLEDMELASSELFTGLHMALLRRYSDAGRELNFVTSGVEQSKNIPDHKNTWLHLFLLVMEICTNDLKYGIGESKWKIIRKGSDLVVQQENKIEKQTKEYLSVPGKRVSERTELMGGMIKAVTKKDIFEIEIYLPNFWR